MFAWSVPVTKKELLVIGVNGEVNGETVTDSGGEGVISGDREECTGECSGLSGEYWSVCPTFSSR